MSDGFQIAKELGSIVEATHLAEEHAFVFCIRRYEIFFPDPEAQQFAPINRSKRPVLVFQ